MENAAQEKTFAKGLAIQKSLMSNKELPDLVPAAEAWPNYDHLRGKIVCIEGTIGAGKTTFASFVKDKLSKINFEVSLIEEQVDVELLNSYIKNPKEYAYAFQLHMLATRKATFNMAKEHAKRGHFVLIDRSMDGDKIFCRIQHNEGNISQEEYALYVAKYHEWSQPPDLILYLQVSLKTCKLRISNRGRKGEDGYTDDYLTSLITEHDAQFVGRKDVVTVNYNKSMGGDPEMFNSLMENALCPGNFVPHLKTPFLMC